MLAIVIIVLTNTFTSVGRGIGSAADELVAGGGAAAGRGARPVPRGKAAAAADHRSKGESK